MDSRPHKEQLRVQVLEAAGALSESAAACRRAVSNDTGKCWVWRDRGVSEKIETREVVAWAMAELDYYRDDQDPRDTLCAPGLVEVGPHALAAIEALNAAKQRFQQRCRDAAHLQAELNGRRIPIATLWLHRNGFPRMNRRQAYRKIPTLDQEPAYIGFSWSNTQLIYTDTREEVERLIRTKVDDDFIERYLQRLADCDDEVFARQIGVDAVRPTCNIRYADGTREHRKAVMPIAIGRGQWPRLREINPVRAPGGKAGRPRSVGPDPWIAELGIYRYMPGYRHAADHPKSRTAPHDKRGNKKGKEHGRNHRPSSRQRTAVA